MLDLAEVDLDGLMEALEDHSLESSWVFHRGTGEVLYRSELLDEHTEEDEDDEDDVILVDPGSSRAGYQDMVDFTALVGDDRVRAELSRALEGRGAFRRFKDRLYERPELRQAWLPFHERRMRRRAVEWLVDRSLVAEDQARAALAELGEEPDRVGPLGPRAVADLAATGLAELYGDRLAGVLLYGAAAHADAVPETGVDLLVVLQDMASPWEELGRMDDLLWELTTDHGVTVGALPVTSARLQRPDRPVLVEAQARGIELR